MSKGTTFNPAGVESVGGSYSYILFDSAGPMYIGKGCQQRVIASLCDKEWMRNSYRRMGLLKTRPHLKEPLHAVVGCTGYVDHSERTAFDLEASLLYHYVERDVGLENRAPSPGNAWQQPESYAKRHTYHLEFLQHMTELMTSRVTTISPTIVGQVFDWANAWFPLTGGVMPQGTVHWLNLRILR